MQQQLPWKLQLQALTSLAWQVPDYPHSTPFFFAGRGIHCHDYDNSHNPCCCAAYLFLQHSLPQLPPQHYLTPQLSMSHSLAPQHSSQLLPQHSMPLLPQHSTPLLQTVESRLAGPETSLDIGSMQLPEASVVGKTACCQAGMGSKHCSSAALSSSAAAGAGSIGTCRICFEQVGHAAEHAIQDCAAASASHLSICLQQRRRCQLVMQQYVYKVCTKSNHTQLVSLLYDKHGMIEDCVLLLAGWHRQAR
jgi:hypothetical protein